MQNQAEEIKQFILQATPKHSNNLVPTVAKKFKVTPTTVHRHINALIKQGKLIKSGNTRNTQYSLQGKYEKSVTYSMVKKLSEEQIFFEDFGDIFKSLKPNVYKICSFGVTEMINNALDHSQGKRLTISTKFANPYLTIIVKDNGIGAFKKICDYLKITDLREGIVHISKGKMTTDPANHSGQGIFFTSRMFDIFSIYANGFSYIKDNTQLDWAFTHSDVIQGTEIHMIININTETNINHIFEKYQDYDFAFDRTEIMVELATFNEELFVSRSQAKRVLLGLEKFAVITLDFKKIDFVGQGFVDEIFRVFNNKHPHITIKYINASPDVTFMIKRCEQ